jgi:hypothetical protein
MGHFYYLDDHGEASPLWEVPYADPSKGMRKANLKDARKFNALPSPNTIMAGEAKPGLVRWSDGLLLDAAWDCKALPYEEYLAESKAKHKELKEAAANEGTAIHNEIERALICREPGGAVEDMKGFKYPAIVGEALNWLMCAGIEVTAVEEYFVNRELGFGGMIDVLGLKRSEYDLIAEPAIADWKSTTTKGKSDSAVTRYWKDKAPLVAAYAMGYYGSLDVECYNVFLSRDEPGRVIEHLFSPDELEFGWKKFQHYYELWVMDKDFDPREQGGSCG